MSDDGSIQIQCDSREARSGIAARLASVKGIEVVQLELACGDYRVGDELLIERKAATDFVLSIMDGRLFEQVAKMAAETSRAVILLEGDPLKVRSEMREESILGAMSAIPVFFNVSLLQAGSIEQSAMLIATMARHVTAGLGYEIGLRAKKPKETGLVAQFLAEGLPGVGPETARKLLNHFGSARKMFSADAAAMQRVNGVGPKTAQVIQAALDAELGQWASTKTGIKQR
jgi:ERCC4-type nuclease